MSDFDKLGGVPVIMKELLKAKLIHGGETFDILKHNIYTKQICRLYDSYRKNCRRKLKKC